MIILTEIILFLHYSFLCNCILPRIILLVSLMYEKLVTVVNNSFICLVFDRSVFGVCVLRFCELENSICIDGNAPV